MVDSEQIIKYEKITEEKFVLPYFQNNDKQEILLVHKIISDNQPNYIIMGHFIYSKIKASRTEIINWLSIIRSLVTNYKVSDKIKKSNYELLLIKLKDHKLTNDFQFTQEGYDLITNKFLFTGNIIERTVYIDDENSTFDNKYKYISDENTVFNDLTYYEDNYFFTPSEKEKLTLEQILDYAKYNSEKLRKVLLNFQSSWYKDVYKQFQQNELETAKFLAQIIDVKMDLFEKSKKR